MWLDQAAVALSGYVPQPVKAAARRWLFKDRHPAHLGLRGVGAVQDLYYWVVDGQLDTLLPIQNYFSVFFPQVSTDTSGTVTLFNDAGDLLGRKQFNLGHLACTKLRVSQLLRDMGVDSSRSKGFGTLVCNLEVPEAVSRTIEKLSPFYFWDRFYIGYLSGDRHVTFVHGIDKTWIYRKGVEQPVDWYPPVRKFRWAPEIPINIMEYERISLIVINRVSRKAQLNLIIEDCRDRRLEWRAQVHPYGVSRFELTPANTDALDPVELRVHLEGMTTQWGRPLLFKHFPSGAVSAMHC